MIFKEESGDKDTEPSYLCDAELDDETIGKALSSPLFIQEREEPADRRQAYHSHEESLLPTQAFSVCHSGAGRPVHELSSLSSCSRQKPSREMENERIRILLERQKEQILADFRADIHALAGDEQLRRDQLLLHEQLSEQNRDLREAHMKSLHEMEKLKRIQGSRFDEFSRRRLIENQVTVHELTARIQELQNEVNCLNDSRDLNTQWAIPGSVFFNTLSRRIQSLGL